MTEKLMIYLFIRLILPSLSNIILNDSVRIKELGLNICLSLHMLIKIILIKKSCIKVKAKAEFSLKGLTKVNLFFTKQIQSLDVDK